MNESLFGFTVDRDNRNDHPLTEAARVALEADPTPRILKFRVELTGMPIEIPRDEPIPNPQ